MNNKTTFILLLSLILWGQVIAQTIYVSPSGNDAWQGTEKKPVKTLTKAKELVSSMLLSSTENVTVLMNGGQYFAENTLAYASSDGGTAQRSVTYKALPGQAPVVTGGVKVTGWQPYKNGIYKTTFKGKAFRQLYVNNQRAIRARFPNSGSYHRLTGWDLKGRNLIVNSDWVQKWDNFEQVEVALQIFWADAYVQLKSFETFEGGDRLAYLAINDKQADILFPRPFPQKQDNAVFHFENALEFIDQAGEWYFNYTSGELFYMPAPGEDINKLEITVPQTETLLSIAGTLDKPVQNLHFEGIVFECSNWNLPCIMGHINGQAGMYNLSADVKNNQFVRRPPAAIALQNSHGVTFKGNLIRNTGSTAIDLISGTRECVVIGNVIKATAGNGVMVGAFTAQPDGEYHIPYNPTDKREVCTGDIISNNHITQIACDYYGCCPVAAGYPAELKIVHNKISNSPYSGISLGYGWTREPNAMHDNYVAFNDISRVVDLICDGGAIYLLSLQPGTKIECNYIHDIYRSPWSGAWPIASLYFDEAAGGTNEKPIVVERNSIPTPDNTVKQWNMHQEGILLLKDNTVYRLEEVAGKAGIEDAYKAGIAKWLKLF